MFEPHPTRRELLRIGSLSLFGAVAVEASAEVSSDDASDRAADESTTRNCIFMMMQGGPSHHELWDPKPAASAEIRGPFQTIATSVPGVRFGELLTHSARVADRLTVIRSMSHAFTNHIAGTYITLTGSTNQPNADREAKRIDFPGPGAILNHLDAGRPGIPASISLPTWLSIPGPSNRMPGQYGGFLGGVQDPFLVEGDPNAAGYQPLSLSLPAGMDPGRLRSRLGLVQQLDLAARQLETEQSERNDSLRESAYKLVVDGRVRKALQVSLESPAVRDRYGRTKIGQSLLLARRLIEAGVRLVGYNEFNQKWDTHGNIAGRYRQIVPEMEQAFAALVEDLDQRGLLDSTVVVNAGEFGRTPVINKGAGRDHWPNAYSIVLAGGGFRAGAVYGRTDAKGAEVLQSPVAPADVLATLWRQLGVNPRTTIYDPLNRPHPVSSGKILHALL